MVSRAARLNSIHILLEGITNRLAELSAMGIECVRESSRGVVILRKYGNRYAGDDETIIVSIWQDEEIKDLIHETKWKVLWEESTY